MSDDAAQRPSVFGGRGMAAVVAELTAEIRELYLADDVPWIIGYSGGKDSTAVLQLVWMAIAEILPGERHKTVHVITTDTGVENPVVAQWVLRSHAALSAAARAQAMPFQVNLLRPRLEESFWVNLIGRGYPAPRHKFRWCTERLKIRPSNSFIAGVVAESGEAILVLGSRKAESITRARTMARHERTRTRARLSPNASLPGTQVYTPVEAWSNDEVWMFLMQVQNPWGHSNRDLLTLYQGASADGECPLVVDTSTPSCGDSRFGCWVCTLVDKDKSMSAMIQNDQDKEWLQPLLDLRNALDFRQNAGDEETSDAHLRDFRRMSGGVQLFYGRPIHGPYLQSAREEWLRMLLEAQCWIRSNGPAGLRKDFTLITQDELQEIRRIWVMEKHEMEDRLPAVYEKATGERYPGPPLDEAPGLDDDDFGLLAEICGEDRLHYELIRELLGVERKQRHRARRAGLFDELEKAFRRGFYEDEADAVGMARRYAEAKAAIDKTPAPCPPVRRAPRAQAVASVPKSDAP